MNIQPVSSRNRTTSQKYSGLQNFEARVDKSFTRFYEVNEKRMPVTLKNYIAGITDFTLITPISAMKKAFEYLELARNVKDIKEIFPDEPLFKNLIEPQESKTGNGIIGLIKQDEEILALSGQSVLKDNIDLTTYLVKKIFLENKTIREINEDLDKDLHEDFKSDFKFKNPDGQYVHKSTLSALGIKSPNPEYRNSLRFTDEAYADMVGEKVSAGLLNFWESMPEEERTARAKKSISSFENWWNSLSKNEILDRIARQISTLDMLKEYKSFKRAEIKAETKLNEKQEPVINSKKTHTKSAKLSSDELFLKWASNNLKIYLANMSEADKDSLHIKRMQHLVSRWAQMSPGERTEYISKMKSGLEPLKFAMIDAWNHSLEIIKDLSAHMKANQIYKPADLLYSSEEFSEFQSKVMTEFWNSHPEHAKKLGKNITLANEKINMAISRGTFEALKKQIIRDKNQRIKDLQKYKINTDIRPAELSSEMEEFKKLYLSLHSEYNYLPKSYVDEYFAALESNLTSEEISAGINNMKSGSISNLSNSDLDYIYSTTVKENSLCSGNNRALEASLANTLYSCTSNPAVYSLSHKELKTALSQLLDQKSTIYVYSQEKDKTLKFTVNKFDISKEKIENLYNLYKQPLTNENLNEIAIVYFDSNDNSYDDLIEYLKTYGKSLNILFSEKSIFPVEVKTEMFNKFIHNMPEEVVKNNKCVYSGMEKPFEFEKTLQIALSNESRELSFLPQKLRDEYLDNVLKCMRKLLNPLDAKGMDSESGMVFVHKFELPQDLQLKVLAAETALGDIFYESTRDPYGYKMHLESFAAPVNYLKTQKHYPAEFHFKIDELQDEARNFTAQKRFNLNSLTQRYFKYYNELREFMAAKHEEPVDIMDLVYILNPDENFEAKDEALINKITVFYDIKFV